MRTAACLSTWSTFILLLLRLSGAHLPAAEPLEYNRDILPILAENCFVCHGPDKATRQGNLRLDNRFDATSSVDHAAAIVPGDPAQSELIRRLSTSDADQHMPPADSGKQLNHRQIELLAQWIETGANYEAHWSLVPPKPQGELWSDRFLDSAATIPEVRTNIDQFVLARMPDELGGFSEPASRLALARRLYLDLTGLPPSADELSSIDHDLRVDAIERLIDRLLASPRFGERWSRWWLDLAHYADSDGYLQDFLRPHAWRYRDWVVDAFNSDLPFDQFTLAQIAGDLLAVRAVGEDAEKLRVATGFLRNTLSNREGGADLEEYRVRQVVDRTVTVATTWLGLTVACAECHDHKYDPLTQVDFYRLYAYFNNCDEVNIDAPLPEERTTYAGQVDRYLHSRAVIIGDALDELVRLQTAWEDRLLWTEQHPGADHRWDRMLEVLGLIWGQGNGEGQLEGLNIIKTPRSERTPMQQARLQDYFLQQGSLIDPQAFSDGKLEGLSTKLSALASQLPAISRPQTVCASIRFRETRVHKRGDFRQPAQTVEPGIPQVFFDSVGHHPKDRIELAQWLVSPQNPLAARVLVNRLWQELLGRGIVNTSENLGVRGAVPSHPELLDWLAGEMIRRQWSLKQLIREIVCTQVYQQSAGVDARKRELDPQNLWLSRSSRLRLSAEGIRDMLLSSSGLLDARIGGPSVRPPQPVSVASEGFDNKWEISVGGDRYRRGVYTFWQRTSPFAQSINFDMPDSSRSCSRRERSNTPLQALALMNDPVLLEAAVMAGYRVAIVDNLTAQQRLDQLHWTILGRSPAEAVRTSLMEYYLQQHARLAKDQERANQLVRHRPENVQREAEVISWAAWSMVASVLLNLDEAINRP